MPPSAPDSRPIALLDSGVGGLSILREAQKLLPHEDLLYFADQAHVPYGPRPLAEIRAIVEEIVRFLLAREAKLIVDACNAASAAALHRLRATFPDVPFVGMEPAVKPAAENTKSGVIGVMTTEATFQGELFASVVGRFAHDKQIVTQVCPEFVELVEAGNLDGNEARKAVRERLEPLLAARTDQLVLGCTHFPFLDDLLKQEAGPAVTIVDPGPAVARQTARLTASLSNTDHRKGMVTHFTSGDPARYKALAAQLLGNVPRDIRHVRWKSGELHEIGKNV